MEIGKEIEEMKRNGNKKKGRRNKLSPEKEWKLENYQKGRMILTGFKIFGGGYL